MQNLFGSLKGAYERGGRIGDSRTKKAILCIPGPLVRAETRSARTNQNSMFFTFSAPCADGVFHSRRTRYATAVHGLKTTFCTFILSNMSYPSSASESGIMCSNMKLSKRQCSVFSVQCSLCSHSTHPSDSCFFSSILSDCGNIDLTGHLPI